MLAVFGLHVVGFKIIRPEPTNRIGITVSLHNSRRYTKFVFINCEYQVAYSRKQTD